MKFCDKCNNTGATTPEGFLDCTAPLCTAAQDRANLDKWMLREGYGQSGIREWAIHQYAVRNAVESAALLLDENERLKTALKQEQATIGKLTLALAARQPLADSFVAQPVAGELPPTLEARRAMFAAYSECLTSTDMLPTDISDKLLAAAHPANGAQAAHQAPFMYAIKGPDGSAYIDENCVSATEEGLYLEVNGLNDSPDAGYSIVPVFLSSAPQKKEG